MQKGINKPLLGRLALLAAALIWGGSFVGMKTLTDGMNTQYILLIRFALSALVMAVVLLPRIHRLRWSAVWRGIVIGVFLYGAYCFQTYGLEHTTPGKNAFLTEVYCVLVPFLYWAVDKSRPDRYNLLAAMLSVIGIGLVSLDSRLTLGLGEGLTLLGGVFFSFHLVAITKLGRGQDTLFITMFQFVGVALCAAVGAVLFEQPPEISYLLTVQVLGPMAYLVLAATCLTITFQTFGQQHTPPSAAAILLSLEAVFGVLISVLAGERPTVPVLCGFSVIFAAVLVSETKLSFFRRRPKN
ncbi:MAG: DMT family transporter [Ruminococcaceae bacterium]|nr:DMT family transporter [Oscillospiraceae bacterium]